MHVASHDANQVAARYDWWSTIAGGDYVARAIATARLANQPPSRPRQDLVLLPDLPLRHDAMQHERIAPDELVDGLAGGEDAPRAAIQRIDQRPRHQERAPRVELVQARPVGGEVQNRFLPKIGTRFVEHYVLQGSPPNECGPLNRHGDCS